MSDEQQDLETINPVKEEDFPETVKVGSLEVNKISEKGKKSIRARVIVALIMIAVVLP